MKRIVVLLAIIFYVAVVGGRSLDNDNVEIEDSYQEDGYQAKHVRDHSNNQRHHLRRRPRQPFYDHYISYNTYDDNYGRRRDDRIRDFYNCRQDELLSRILNELEELSNYVKKTQTPPPPPAPQFIYVPFPYPVLQFRNQTNPFIPSINDKIFLDDKNRNWGLIPGDLGLDNDDGSDGSRPINLNPIESNEPTVKPPPVEHGSSQAGMTTAKPTFKEPGRCRAAILVCCQDTSNQKRQECFANYGCLKTYSFQQACHPRILKQVIEEFAETYAPINNT